MTKYGRVCSFGIGGDDCGPVLGQIYRVVTFCLTVDCYKGGKSIKVSGWIKALPEEQDIYSQTWHLFKDCGQSPYWRK